MNCVDDSRLKQFQQLKTEIRGSEQHLIVGIDVAKEKHRAFFGTAQGKTLLKNLVFDNTVERFEKLDASVERIKVQYGLSKHVFGIEPTANYHKPLAGSNTVSSFGSIISGGLRLRLRSRIDSEESIFFLVEIR